MIRWSDMTSAVPANPLILGIESSCDETAAAVVRGAHDVRSNVIATQHDLHEEYAGVVPEIASRAHLERIMPVMERAVTDAACTWDDLDAVAVGNRPGLIGSLLVGVAAAKALAWSLDVPLVGVDHIHAHLHAGTLDADPVTYPALGSRGLRRPYQSVPSDGRADRDDAGAYDRRCRRRGL